LSDLSGSLIGFMNKSEAREILTTEVAKFRGVAYEQLAAMVDGPTQTTEIVGPSGTRYFIGIVVYGDGEAGGDVRVIATIDDGGWRAFVPMSDDFIKAPDGSFVGESA
jgi:hypothetical protein